MHNAANPSFCRRRSVRSFLLRPLQLQPHHHLEQGRLQSRIHRRHLNRDPRQHQPQPGAHTQIVRLLQEALRARWLRRSYRRSQGACRTRQVGRVLMSCAMVLDLNVRSRSGHEGVPFLVFSLIVRYLSQPPFLKYSKQRLYMAGRCSFSTEGKAAIISGRLDGERNSKSTYDLAVPEKSNSSRG